MGLPGAQRKKAKLFKKDFSDKPEFTGTINENEFPPTQMPTQDRFKDVEEYEHILMLREQKSAGLPLTAE